MTPRDSKLCTETGRLCTEWFEEPEYTDEQLKEMACEEVGLDPDEYHVAAYKANDLQKKAHAIVQSKKQVKWRHNMSQQEVQMRMNEATKMVSPDNFKFLPDDVRERTGLEINPLWMMECLVRSGVLQPKDQIGALKELAQYTHSKSPSLNHSTVTHAKPEDWLVELAEAEYQEIIPNQPKTPVERHAGPDFERKALTAEREVNAIMKHGARQLDGLEVDLDDIDLEGFNIDD